MDKPDISLEEEYVLFFSYAPSSVVEETASFQNVSVQWKVVLVKSTQLVEADQIAEDDELREEVEVIHN